ncbi:unnamed protein product [Angiostrongylus costaricensis]|uniref:Ras-associating domain-containing protein n=1 Tax=Angiostrongylus costaricensis TaxID=334426 RepID=A0A0R3PNA6_ANGCS|nr:unnamed protein product [Angiostrongylus costaricensis]
MHRYAEEHSCDTFRKSSKPCQVSDSTTASSSVIQKSAQSKVKPLNEIERKKMDRILVMKLKMNAKITAEIPTEEKIFLFIEGDDTRERQVVLASQSLQIFIEQSEEPLDYAEVVSKYLHDMDTISVQLV